MKDEYLNIALSEAKIAYNLDEVPIGCAIFKGDKLIAKAHNMKENKKNSIMHAEIIAINSACEKLNSWRLDDCVMYVTLEPCMMCMGAIIESRIKNVYYGTKNNSEQMYDKNKVLSLVNSYDIKNAECSELLSNFFINKRKK